MREREREDKETALREALLRPDTGNRQESWLTRYTGYAIAALLGISMVLGIHTCSKTGSTDMKQTEQITNHSTHEYDKEHHTMA